ncbi:MAG: hypothetical protein IPM50_10555 [Acidobacteriota bacterium]|nr:MAG: hypothetical protein IPM50_10555 [Acidobacteriota bacterium]
MQDVKNIILAWFSTATGLLAAATDRLTLTVVSVVVLPILFFVIGKTSMYCCRSICTDANDVP